MMTASRFADSPGVFAGIVEIADRRLRAGEGDGARCAAACWSGIGRRSRRQPFSVPVDSRRSPTKRRKIMRLLETQYRSCAAPPSPARRWRRAGEDPRGLRGAGRQLAVDPVREAGARAPRRQVVRVRGGALPGHAADDHRARHRARGRRPGVRLVRDRGPERRHGRPARHRRRVPGRRRGLLHERVLRPEGQRRSRRSRT